jgi:pSer/pThr/pTyr-binding forkhead associated (FHA) protein
MLAKLISMDGDRPIVLTKDVTVVGRKRGVCDVYIDRSSVSKLHCVIVKTDGLLFIRDLGSTNGTKVNGQRVTRGALLPGDELGFANAQFRVYLGPDEPEEGPPPDGTEVMDSFPLGGMGEPGDSFGNDDDDGGLGSASDVRLLGDASGY